MFSVGHLASGYLSGKATSRLTKTSVNVPLLFLFSLIPDIDLLFPNLLQHRGPTHSLIVFCLLFLPFFIFYGARVLPYLVCLASHTLADGLIGGAQALWPLTTRFYGTGIRVESLTNIYAEWILFLASLTLLLATKEMWKLFKPHPSNLLLAIPIISIFDSTFLHFPIPVPPQLIIPHLINLAIFTISILIDLKSHIYNIARAVSSEGPARNNRHPTLSRSRYEHNIPRSSQVQDKHLNPTAKPARLQIHTRLKHRAHKVLQEHCYL